MVAQGLARPEPGQHRGQEIALQELQMAALVQVEQQRIGIAPALDPARLSPCRDQRKSLDARAEN